MKGQAEIPIWILLKVLALLPDPEKHESETTHIAYDTPTGQKNLYFKKVWIYPGVKHWTLILK